MMEKGKSSLLRLVEEKAMSREVIEKEKRKDQEDFVMPYLPSDCISNILLRLPIDSLPQLRFICKPWYKIINSPTFIDAHFRSSNTVLIFLQIVGRDISLPSKGKSNLFPIESKLQTDDPFGLRKSMFDPLLLYSMNFIEITGQKGMVKGYNSTCLGNIRASYNGLVLLDNKIKKGGLIIMNPVTREAIDLPLGTLFPGDESYGLTFCSHVNDYKVVHLFKDHLRYVGCEILDLSTRRWRMVDGPPFDFFNWLGCNPVFANEALYWLPRLAPNDYLVSFALDDEKFHKLQLPKFCSSSHDRIFQMAGELGLVTHEEPYRIVLWGLNSSCTEAWKKQYNITVDCKHVIPLYCTEETGEFIFTDTNGSLYSYDLYLHYTKKIEVKNGSSAVHGFYIPHVNSLLSWRTQPKDRYMDN